MADRTRPFIIPSEILGDARLGDEERIPWSEGARGMPMIAHRGTGAPPPKHEDVGAKFLAHFESKQGAKADQTAECAEKHTAPGAKERDHEPGRAAGATQPSRTIR